ncbi:MAG: hypothetical protein CO129_02765 [Ignavibacteriales bacterium CG_4_9_14_3_um_filter_34_10]|nr:MAG: hypothetical protein CO129_02765 [Ignavibacteriales bacterium CG_4_9_14_3_um_filter_34_10]
MIKHYIIDGNNVIGRNKDLMKDKINSRSRLRFIMEKYFIDKKVSVNLYFDGHEKEKIKSDKLKIIYSNNHPADDLIRDEIAQTKNCKTVCLVTSDLPLAEFGKKNSCTIKSSDEFLRGISVNKKSNEKESAAESISNSEMMKLFGLK